MLALEELPENRDVADAGNLLQRRVHGAVEQPGDGKRLSVEKLDFRFGTSRGERGNPESIQDDGVAEVERADLGPYFEVNAVAGHNRGEIQPDAKLLEHHRDGHGPARPLSDGYRELSAGQEARFLSTLGDEIRFGKGLEQSSSLERLDHYADVILLVEEKEVQKIAERNLPRCAGDVAAKFVVRLGPSHVAYGRRGELLGRRADDVVLDSGRARDIRGAKL